MDNFAAARSQMGMSLGFHIVFAVIGVALPLMMTIAEWRFRANVRLVHICFQTMVGCGSVLSLFALVAAWLAWRKPPLSKQRGLLRLLVLVSPLGFIALEAGLMVTELGRQPWIIYHLMRTKEAVTSLPNIGVPLTVMTVVYLLLAVIFIRLLWRHVIASPDTEDIEQTGVLV